MHVSLEWLEQFITLDADPETIAKELTLRVAEVEEVMVQGKDLDHIVVGVVSRIEKHPDADKLQVCEVDIGDERLQVVCGGNNLSEGMKVAMGKIGAKVKWHGEGELVELKKTKIRGVESYGMICASDEIGLDEMFPKSDENEILDLSSFDAVPGSLLVDALHLSGVVFDIENKTLTHRPDLWGHYGMAREIAAIRGLTLKDYNPPQIKAGSTLKLKADIQEPELCRRFMAVAVEGIEIGPSPAWMQARLNAAGMRPINNIVDITNYVMLELGQPTHAFDARMVQDHHFVIRKTNQKTFTTLDEQERVLSGEMLMIADTEKELSVAGIMGGEQSGISDDTTTVIFEAANFKDVSIRKTSTKLGLRTDSSARFEKSLDPHNAELALKRLVELTLEICPGASVASSVVDEGSFELEQGPIELTIDFINQKIGNVQIEVPFVKDTLERLGFGVKEKKGTFFVTIPTWRATKDIKIKEDIVEEIARLYGYENVKGTLPSYVINPPPLDPERILARSIRTTLAYEAGCSEVYNYSFVSPELLGKLEIGTDNYLELDNPIAKDRPYLRRQLLPNMLVNVESNLHRYDRVALFELGRTYIAEDQGLETKKGSGSYLPNQDTYLGVVIAEKGSTAPFYDVSDAFSLVFDRLSMVHTIKESKPTTNLGHPGRFANILVQDEVVGYITELHPKLQTNMGIGERVGVAELNLSKLAKIMKEDVRYEALSTYPAVPRDLACSVPLATKHADVVQAIQSVDTLVVSVELFDVYQGKGVEDGYKSVAYHIVYRSSERTLEAEEVDGVHTKVIEKLEKEFGAVVRK